MNEFTKNELMAILEALTIIDKDATIRPEIYWNDDLPLKICNMIENYCEHECQHESDGYDYFKIAEGELLMDVLKKRKCELKCKKCGVIW